VPKQLSPDAAPRGYQALLNNRTYRTLMGSEVMGHVGRSLYLTVLPWLVLEVTGSNSAVGWATTAIYLPYLVFAVAAGTLVDRLDRRRMMIAVNLLRALLAAAVPMLHVAGILAGWHILLIAFLLSSLDGLFYLGRSSVVPQIVPREEIVTANSAITVLVGLAMMAGTVLVGPVVHVLGLANASAFYVATLILSTFLLSPLQLPPQTGQGERVHRLTWRDLLQGVSYVWHAPVVRTIFMLDALYFVLADGMLRTGVPLFVKDVLHAGPEVYGYIQTAGNAGMLLGALWLGRFGRSLRKERLIVLGWLGYGLSLISYPLFRAFAPALAASFFSLMIGNLIPTCGASLLQERVPQELLGRVFGVWNMIAPGSGSFSGIIGGALAGVLPASVLIMLGAAVSCGNALLGRIGGLWHDSATQSSR
jgi:DHA3 family macrolide efflux protein-like MFS transporter